MQITRPSNSTLNDDSGCAQIRRFKFPEFCTALLTYRAEGEAFTGLHEIGDRDTTLAKLAARDSQKPQSAHEYTVATSATTTMRSTPSMSGASIANLAGLN